MSSAKWFTTFNKEQKANVLRKFHTASVDDIIVASRVHLPVGCSKNEEEPGSSREDDVPTALNSDLSVSVERAADLTGLPILFLRHTMSKAFELIRNGSVVVAPCFSTKARMVGSKSMKQPHFVNTSKDDEILFECDNNCSGFSHRHICAHTIAAAEHNTDLEDYLDDFGKFVKTSKGYRVASPNFSKVSMSGLPRGTAGRKGSKAPQKKAVKRRNVVDEENRTDIINTLPCQDDDLDDEAPILPPPIVSQSPTSSNVSNSVFPSSSTAPVYDTFQFQQYPYYHDYFNYPPAFGYPQWQSYPTTRSSYYPNNCDTHSKQLSNPFYIRLLNSRIKVCAGCKGPHLKGANGRPLPSPHNLCLSRRENMSYMNPKTGLQSTKEGNCYYHLNRACVLKKMPTFSPSQVVCPEDISLDTQQKDYIKDAIGLLL